MLCIVRNDLDQSLWTGSNTLAAGYALFLVYNSYAVYNMDRVKLTCLYAGAIAHTAVSACLFAGARSYGYHGTIGNSIVVVLYVCLGVVLTAAGIYEPLVDLAGCGATTPLTGFGYSLAKGVQKAVDERGLIGAITGGLTGTAGGITVAIVSGLIIGALFKEKEK